MTPDALREQPASPAEIADLLRLQTVYMGDAARLGQSADSRYVAAYTAGFALAKIVLRASGYRVGGPENHRDTLLAVPVLMGSGVGPLVRALDGARTQRNVVMYDSVGMIEHADVEELLEAVRTLEAAVRAWLVDRHPELLG